MRHAPPWSWGGASKRAPHGVARLCTAPAAHGYVLRMRACGRAMGAGRWAMRCAPLHWHTDVKHRNRAARVRCGLRYLWRRRWPLRCVIAKGGSGRCATHLTSPHTLTSHNTQRAHTHTHTQPHSHQHQHHQQQHQQQPQQPHHNTPTTTTTTTYLPHTQ